MKIISATTRVAFGLVCLSFSVAMMAYSLGLFPDRQRAVVDGRAALSETVALHCTLLASRNDRMTIATALDGLVQRNTDVLSAAIRGTKGELIHAAGPHESLWSLPSGYRSTPDQMRVPILSGDSPWGLIELRFSAYDYTEDGLFGSHPLLRLLVFFLGSTSILYVIFLRRTFRNLDPSRVISPRVRRTLDTLAEGLLVLDDQARILLANTAFAEKLGANPDELIGRKASELPFDEHDNHGPRLNRLPWERAMEEGEPQLGELLTLRGKEEEPRVLRVNAAPVIGDDGKQRGVLASFNDVTQLEASRIELRRMLGSISASRDEIKKQNIELERLASHDSLTGCLNRRAFFAAAESQWSTAARHDQPLACIMVDVDHFKSVNDHHGHQMGDTVLQRTASLLCAGRRPIDLTCRYGGEEFCILLPQTDVDGATIVAEKIRAAVEGASFNGLSITASLGISARSLGGSDTQQLIDQADQCLYVAKHEGRNRVVRFDQAAERITTMREQISGEGEGEEGVADNDDSNDASLPFHAVTALVSALAFRDPSTADHSRRVADLCVATANGLMPASESFILESAALLHDVGKIGVPDSILLKPGKLTLEERRVMKSHERVGVEIVQSTFANPKLAEIIRTYRAWFVGSEEHPELPAGNDIPLAARILSIADAYDSMTNPAVYREPLSREHALDELRRCAGKQFDPDLVDRFADALQQGEVSESHPGDASKAVALSFGTQVERLVVSLQHQDFRGIAALAKRLNLTATQYGESRIAEIAGTLHLAVGSDSDINDMAELINELLELCCMAQRTQLDESGDAADPASGVDPASGADPAEPVSEKDTDGISREFFPPDSDAGRAIA
jgi:diguanylate cyclase (GGDEF)-like protein/PAS domain S-box-containing protein/putative nucleotidyltransferase with HDIG domain